MIVRVERDNATVFPTFIMKVIFLYCKHTLNIHNVLLLVVHIPSATRKELASFLKKVTVLVPALHAIDVDVPLSGLLKDEALLEKVVLGREFHISLGRTVPIRVHQIHSMVSMLRQKLQFQSRFDVIKFMHAISYFVLGKTCYFFGNCCLLMDIGI